MEKNWLTMVVRERWRNIPEAVWPPLWKEVPLWCMCIKLCWKSPQKWIFIGLEVLEVGEGFFFVKTMSFYLKDWADDFRPVTVLLTSPKNVFVLVTGLVISGAFRLLQMFILHKFLLWTSKTCLHSFGHNSKRLDGFIWFFLEIKGDSRRFPTT